MSANCESIKINGPTGLEGVSGPLLCFSAVFHHLGGL